MRRGWVLTVLAIAMVAAPTTVMAATGSFSSSSSTTALTVSNTGSGIAIRSAANSGYGGYFTRSATSGTTPALYVKSSSASSGAPAISGRAVSTGSGATIGVKGQSDASNGRGLFGYASKGSSANYGVYGVTNSANANAAGVYGVANSLSGQNQGVWGDNISENGAGVYGTGVFGMIGQGLAYGVLGIGGGIGDGTYGLATGEDAALWSHVTSYVADASTGNTAVSDFAGQCEITADQMATCTWEEPFETGIMPIVVTTPTSDMGYTWVDGVDETAFTVHCSAASCTGDVNYIVVGMYDNANPPGATAASAQSFRGRALMKQ